ncbi:MAG: lysylphosphatidylglycerol synthase transmembrane domain-containing protein [Myxococcales bacterium]|nr:lysylphosphatidylglycerol synthase transmembrane domain-containing protein [Myxococcales bacterium]
MSLGKWVKFSVSLAITVGCLYLTFKDTRWPEMWGSLRSANYAWVAAYVLVLAVIHVARTMRWGNLLSGLERVPFKPLNEASAIGFMMLIILPFRLGEFARPYLIAERSKIRRSAAMTTVVLERIVDGIIIASMLRILLFFVPTDAPRIEEIALGSNVMFLVFGGGLAFLIVARWQHDRVVALMRTIIGKVSPKMAERAVYVVDGFVSALKQLPDAKNFAAFTFWTAVYWSANGYGMSLLTRAFDCSNAAGSVCEPLTLTVFQGFVVLSVLIVGLMIPAAPGSAGTFQAFVLLGLSVFVSKDSVNSSGIAYANVLWVVQILQQILFGMLILFISHGSFKDIAGKLSNQDDKAERATA